ncbi:hypothetical protein KAU11_06710 [Candidatus Babeliales bacterium]|nr:hypothetical protein [Candidatus Babeliales bacterium]
MNKSSDTRVKEALKHNTNTLNYWAGKMKQNYCANNELELVMPVIEERDGVEKATKGDIAVKEGTCSNAHRYNSKFCQKCSDEHNGVEHVPDVIQVHKKDE